MTQPANRRLVTEDRFLVTEAEAAAAYDAVNSIASLSPNYIINGAMDFNQRNFTSITGSTTVTYGFDRWGVYGNGGTTTCTPQTFTPGQAPGGGYESSNFLRIATSGQTATSHRSDFRQYIEDVRTLAGRTVTVSFWAKAASGTPYVAIEWTQNTGFGAILGNVSNGSAKKVQLTGGTSWTRYSVTLTTQSLLGVTIGASNITSAGVLFWVSGGSDYDTRTGSLGIQSNTFDFWGVQVEAGSVATAFRRNANSLQGELAACQRYYWRTIAPGVNEKYAIFGTYESASLALGIIKHPVNMRISAVALEYSSVTIYDMGAVITPSSIAVQGSGTEGCVLRAVTSGGTTRAPALFLGGSSGSYIGFSAEL